MRKYEFELKLPNNKLITLIEKIFSLLRKNKGINVYFISYELREQYEPEDRQYTCLVGINYSWDGNNKTQWFQDWLFFENDAIGDTSWSVNKVQSLQEKVILRIAGRIWSFGNRY